MRQNVLSGTVDLEMDADARTPRRTEGTTLGRYRLYDRIASGGMASVHFGRLAGRAGFSRLVAIKKLHDHVARDPKFVAMLLDEARLVALVRHPNVVPTLEIVEGDDTLAVVMEYVAGESLERLVDLLASRGERLPQAIAAYVVAQLLQGLHAAHEAVDSSGVALEIVHRDISPQNVLVGIDGVARILDFGVARARSRLQGTETGELKGKIAYMSPEQLQQTGVDRRNDIFATGIVLWELLTGKPLFLSSSPIATIANVLNLPIEAPSLAGSESDAFDAIVMKALERDRDQRFDTADEMANAIEAAAVLPKPKEVGAWVAHVAEASLAARAAIARRVESYDPGIMRSPTGSSMELSRVIDEVEKRMGDATPEHEASAPPVDYVDSDVTERDAYSAGHDGDDDEAPAPFRSVETTERLVGFTATARMPPPAASRDEPVIVEAPPTPFPASSPALTPPRPRSRLPLLVGLVVVGLVAVLAKLAFSPRVASTPAAPHAESSESAPSLPSARESNGALVPLPADTIAAPRAADTGVEPIATNPASSIAAKPRGVQPRNKPTSDRHGE